VASIILKATEACNSNCVYCDVVAKERKTVSMPLDVLELVFVRINEFLRGRPGERATVMWHGGEPLLLGPGYFEAALRFQEDHCRETKGRIDHCIQSNLTLFSEDFIEVFRGLGITQVGTSYDPEPHVRGPGEGIDSDRYNRMFMRATEGLERNGFGWGVIYVVTKLSLLKPLEVFFFLTNLKLDGGFSMNPVLIYDKKRNDIAITPEEYLDFLGAIFPVWWRHRNRYPMVEPFSSITRCVKDRALSLGCVHSGGCARNHVNIGPDGGTSQCGRSADWGLLDYGNIQDRTLGEVLGDPQREQFLERDELLRETECKGCRFWTICHGGCPLDAFSEHGSFMHKTAWCASRRGFMEKYYEPVTGLRFEPFE
jgi:uncharacterized protein